MATASTPIIKDWAQDLRKRYDNSPNRLASQANKVDTILSQTDDLFRIPESALLASQQFSDSPHIPNVLTPVYTVRAVVSAFRVIPTTAYLLSGQIRKETWTDTVIRIIMAVARFLSPIAWLHKLKAIDLGVHAKWISYTIMSAFTALGIVSLIKSIRSYTSMRDRLGAKTVNGGVTSYQNRDAMKEALRTAFDDQGWSEEKLEEFFSESIRNDTGDIVSDSLELLCAPWENGIVLSNNFGFVMAGASLNFLSSTVKLIRL